MVIFHRSSGKSIRNIPKLVNLSHSTVLYVIKHCKENQIENKVRKGQPRKLTKHNERFIFRKFVENPHLSTVKVSAEFNEKFSTSISPYTVRRVLVRKHDIKTKSNLKTVRMEEWMKMIQKLQKT